MSLLANRIVKIFTPPALTQVQHIHEVEPWTDWRMLKDYKKRLCVKEHAKERLRVNSLRKNDILPQELREIADAEIAAMPRDSSITRLVGRCTLTSRPRGVVYKYRVSRIMFRHLADYNKLACVQRARW